jgi:hypothetical protein
MESLNIVHNKAQQRFEAFTDGDLAVLEYRWEDGSMALTHTFVPPAARGKGLAAALAKHALDYVRAHKLIATVYCPYVLKYLTTHPEYLDIVKIA